jgi:hypothetical protein
VSSRSVAELRASGYASPVRHDVAEQNLLMSAPSVCYWRAAKKTLIDPDWFVGTLFAIGGVLGALWGIYDAHPSWGEAGPVTSAFAIVGAGLAAIGAKTIFTGAK